MTTWICARSTPEKGLPPSRPPTRSPPRSIGCCTARSDDVAEVERREVAESALKTCEEIDQLESDADRVMRSAMSALFREEPDTRQQIKLKAVYEHLESISDRCEDVANVVEGIVLENS